MDIPATSDNIPGTLVLRDSSGSVNSFQSSGSNAEAPTNGRGELFVDNINTSSSTHSKVQFRSRDTTDIIRHGASVTMLKDGNWVGGSQSYPGHLTLWTRPLTSGDQLERMRITSAGDVGIGTTTPTEKLEVNGTVKAAGFSADGIQIDGLSGRNYFRDGEAAGQLRVGAAWGLPGIYAESGRCVVGGQAGVSIEPVGIGNIGVGTAHPNSKAMLDISSTTRGFLPPRMTTAERDAITSPPAGLMLYNSTTNKLQVRTDTTWVDLH